MATLQKFKLLATQCTVVGSPTRSPTTSPVIHIRRRRTLRMLLGRDTAARNAANFQRRFHQPPPGRENSPDRRNDHAAENKRRPETGKEHFGVRLKLKDLFVSSPPPATIRREEKSSAAVAGIERFQRRIEGGEKRRRWWRINTAVVSDASAEVADAEGVATNARGDPGALAVE